MKTRILDCTLRDGGYCNNWEFGKNNISHILSALVLSNVDIIEAGFLTNKITFNDNISKYSNIEELSSILPKKRNNSMFVCMINYGEYLIENIPNKENSNIDGIRIAFHKKNLNEALEFSKKVKDKGYKVFVQPMLTLGYDDREFLDLIDKVNKIEPFAFYIVDSFGTMKANDVSSYFDLIDRNLSKDISVGFHSHNSLQLAFPNSQMLLEKNTNRDLIIDSSVFGMGRGAGNLCTELITQYINDNYNGEYDIVPILKIIDECINPIFIKTPWGYSVPYYLAAVNHCHPNYAKYLADKQTIPVEMINILLNAIPRDKRSFYDVELIKKIYLENFSNEIDDGADVGKFKEMIASRSLLILGPGRSIENEKDRILEFIEKNNPFIISLNFEPKDYKADLVFVTNIKRFLALGDTRATVMSTSNIEHSSDLKINYSSYLNHSKMYDNVALMLFKLLMSTDIKSINIAGLDGFSTVANENYFSAELVNNSKLGDIDERNEVMKAEIRKVSKEIKVEFVTGSRYVEQYINDNKKD